MRFGHTEIFVSDPIRSMHLYVSVLGFELVENQGNQYIWLVNNGSLFLLRPHRDADTGATYQQTPSAIVLYSSDIEADRARLEAGGIFIQGYDGTPECLTFMDFDGNWFQLANPGIPHSE